MYRQSTDQEIRASSNPAGIFSNLRIFLKGEREVLVVWILALAVYLPAIWWGLPHATHPLGVHGWDIDAVTGLQTLSELHNLLIEPKPDWYLAYPLFHYLVVGFFYAPYFVFLYLTGGIAQPISIYPFGFADPVAALKHLALIGRTITVLMASGVVVNAYLTARIIWDKPTARLTAIAAALPVPMFYYARTGNLDVPVLFWMSLAILVLARCLKLGFTVGRGVWLGIFSALAVATKDQAFGPLAVGLTMLVILHFWKGTPNTETTSSWKAPAALVAAGFVTFVSASGLPISPTRFFGHLSFVRNFETTFDLIRRMDVLQPATPLGYSTLSLDVLTQLLIAFGPILVVAGIIGLILSWRTATFSKVLVALLCGYLILVIFQVRLMQYRYVMFPAFIFAFFVGKALATGLKQSRRAVAVSTLAVSIAGFGWLTLRDIDLTYQMLFDARYAAGSWIQVNRLETDKIAYFTAGSTVQLYAKKDADFVSDAKETQEPDHASSESKAVWLLDDPSPIERLTRENVRFVLAEPDFSSDIGSHRSRFFPEQVYQQMQDGSLGYRKSAFFETPGLFKGFLLDLPLVGPGYIVNPPVEIFDKGQPSITAEMPFAHENNPSNVAGSPGEIGIYSPK